MLWPFWEDYMAAAQVGDGLVKLAGHCCHPTALAMGGHTVPGGELQLPIPPCPRPRFSLVGVWGKAWLSPLHSCTQHDGLHILIETFQVPKEKKYVNGEPRWRGYVSTSQKKKITGMWYLC